MSLFGDDDQDTPQAASKSSGLFEESTNTNGGGPGLFGAETSADDVGGGSPWDFTPRKQNSRGNPIKSLLANTEVPDLYIDTYDELGQGTSVSAQSAKQLLSDSGIAVGDQDKIWRIISNGQEVTGLGRAEFNVLLALIGLAQEGEELGLDAVDERKSKLPVPNLPKAQRQLPPPQTTQKTTTPTQGPPGQQQNMTPAGASGRKQSFGAGFGSDPWASPEVHKGHNHLNGIGAQRTTSNFTTTSATEPDAGGSSASFTGPPPNSSGNAWGASSYGAATSEGFAGSAVPGEGFGGDDDNNPSVPRPPRPVRNVTSKGQDEVITVQLLEEKEGMFMFQHRNYEVSSVRRNSKVIRRYSDFVWLLDCLHKRYPFRQLPLLPPKRMSINGNHIAADSGFMEKRRRGLARFANALVRHPVLREEQLVVMFLTVPTELAVWRKQATISVQEEFVGKGLPPGLEDSLPANLQETFDTCRSGVRRSAELYINLCNLVERLCKRKEAIAGEYGRFSLNLSSLTEVSNDTYTIDTNDVPLLNEGINATAKHLGTSQSLLEDEGRAWDQGLLEDCKTLRDAMVSMREMFDRRDRFARDNIPQLEKRIAGNEQKLQTIRAKGDLAKPGEAEKVENAITSDKQSIVNQHARGVFIKECIRDELHHFQSTIGRVSRLHQDWAQERVKYVELQADNFRALVDALEGMPLDD
ncbi:hypothetical protein K431DRAFT_263972 [Polychaeton citri CBS 116435]|uniref:Sorting nexin MVP1 n=1 Tax=Polychaeton citri CBS 116435 TaxID=1314669 RepID=A0A9P4QEZ8_9PEZI|nr:hypothetical protein K431DRAFT_263972 [Polychaeton citri CBS 116435]